jgi:hypothetical protein
VLEYMAQDASRVEEGQKRARERQLEADAKQRADAQSKARDDIESDGKSAPELNAAAAATPGDPTPSLGGETANAAAALSPPRAGEAGEGS